MKVLYAAIIILLLLCVFIFMHSYLMSRLSSEIITYCQKIASLAEANQWKDALVELKNINEAWERLRLWTALTISTNEIDKIEISLSQCVKFAQLEAKPDFFGEFTHLCMYIERLPRKEGFHAEEIL